MNELVSLSDLFVKIFRILDYQEAMLGATPN